jgi:hypothetical protein
MEIDSTFAKDFTVTVQFLALVLIKVLDFRGLLR